ncbi:MAG: SRPBCC family protein [cyanobacterium endosymbiont of Rhopalodia inflata]
MMLNFSFKLMLMTFKGKLLCAFSLYKRYRVVSTAPVDVLWQKLINLADVSWHPLFSKTNVPLGLIAKPGLIYQVVTRFTPIPIRLFVENVRPGELLSMRVLAIPGIEQKITYQVESTLCGSYISYSVTLRGWLSPLIWWLIQPYSARVASDLANAAERLA